MQNVYKLCFQFSGKDPVYISTDMSLEEVADIYVGFEFYIEFNTRYGDENVINEEVAAYLLCNICGCSVYDEKKLHLLNKYDPETADLNETEWIDLFDERERRCCPDYEQYIQKILKYKDAEFFRKLCAYFDSEEIHARPLGTDTLSPEEIAKKY